MNPIEFELILIIWIWFGKFKLHAVLFNIFFQIKLNFHKINSLVDCHLYDAQPCEAQVW
jgi:hypothetical protein